MSDLDDIKAPNATLKTGDVHDLLRIYVDAIYITPNQDVTVWLAGTDNATPIELRVQSDGTKQIFLDDNTVEIRSFEEWTKLCLDEEGRTNE